MNKLDMFVNHLRRVSSFMSDIIQGGDTKHNKLYSSYGYPLHLEFQHFFQMYERNGIARAGVEKAVEKTWESSPWVLEEKQAAAGTIHTETQWERDLRMMLDRLEFWTVLSEADKMGRVGRYAGIILRYADGKVYSDPVDRVPGGTEGLVDIIPVYEGQLLPAEWVTDEQDPNYGQPSMYQFIESAVDTDPNKQRNLMIHPDRVHIWAKRGSVHGKSVLEAGFNDLLTIQKIIGAGGEGYFKTARAPAQLNMEKDASLDKLAASLGTNREGLADKLDEVVEDWQKGFDNVFISQGMEMSHLTVSLPEPEKFVTVALWSYCASINTPMKVLIGNQTGERASSEDNDSWAQFNMSRRSSLVIPNIKRLINKLIAHGIIREKAYKIEWSDLTEANISEKINRADKMATINQKMIGRGEVYTPDEIRDVTGHDPLDQDVVPDA